MNKQKQIIGAWTLSILWMAVIYSMSAMTGEASGEQSGALAQLLLEALSRMMGWVNAEKLEFIVRKGSHMAEYAVLFMLYLRAFRVSGVKGAGRISFFAAVAYAATDEFHQLFVPGRAGCVSDVMIDACGAGMAWAAATIAEKTKVRFGK